MVLPESERRSLGRLPRSSSAVSAAFPPAPEPEGHTVSVQSNQTTAVNSQ